MTQTDDAVHTPVRYADLILAALDRRPDRAAFHWRGDSDPAVWSYADVASHIRRLSTALSNLRLARSDGIALLAGPRPEAFMVMAAACHAGIRYTALHPMATHVDDAFVLRDSGSAVLVVDDSRFDERTNAARDAVRVVPLRRLNDLARDSAPSANISADATYLFYTGGTTGEPKGVILRDRSLTANAWASSTWDWQHDTRFLITTPMSHAAGLLVAPGLLHGADFHIHDRFDPARVLHAIEHDGVNTTFLVPTMLYSLLDHPEIATADLSGLRWILYGAAPTAPSRIIEARERFGAVLTQHYGQAEAPNALTTLDKYAHCTDDHSVLSSCGRVMPGVTLTILDHDGNAVPPGMPGELCVRGPLVMDGYWNKPDETAAALAGGWLHTGDVATCDENGLISIVDRSKDMVITGGFNVYPREVETVLSAHPSVEQCAVYGEPDERWGEAVIAAVVTRAGREADADLLISHVRTAKGGVCTPKRIDFYERLPSTPLGKIDKKALRRRARSDAI
ncbi:MAG: AMP-binding protein [Pseudonocardia sp.]|uniref:AMP-binding protein n=1 Tax=Pseudonocardia sp. TaxID=60912 RepID=UPI001ACBEB5A|nr:AMP-binding protein [Pseudonocardia sp.]MBN9096520.1 AMP-binding protein [Pseudonocardia sp.]